MNRTLLVALILVCAPFVAGAAAATYSCGPIIDSCTGDSNTDNPYAGCNGTWRDIYTWTVGFYAQVCVDNSHNCVNGTEPACADKGPNVWLCPNTNNFSVKNPNCTKISWATAPRVPPS